jgi:hypothetical protein
MRGLSVVCAAFTQKNSRVRFFGFDGSISFFLVVKKTEEKNVCFGSRSISNDAFYWRRRATWLCDRSESRVGRERPSVTPEKIASKLGRAPERALARRRRRRASTVTLDDARRLTDRPRNGTMAAFTVSMNGTCRFRPRRAITRGPSDAPPSFGARPTPPTASTDRPPIRLARYR